MIKHTRPECSRCTGISNCTKYCDIKVGENIIKFVNGVDSEETAIGEFRKDSSGKATLIVSGFMLEKSANPTHIITRIEDCTINRNGKLGDFRDTPPSKFIKAFADYNNVDQTIQDKVIEKFNGFNGKGVVPVPVKPGTEIEVCHIGFDNKLHRTRTYAKFVKWVVDKKTGEINGYIVASVDKTDNGSNHVTVPIAAYGEEWFLPNIERNIKTVELVYDVVKMNTLGLIKPIEFYDGVNLLAVDGNNIYLNRDDVDYIIGCWDGESYKLIGDFDPSIQKCKAFKKMSESLRFIYRHKRFIAPYGLVEPNHIKC